MKYEFESINATSIKIFLLAVLCVCISPADAGECLGYGGPGGACYAGPEGGLYAGPGGGLYAGPGGGLYAGPGGGIYSGPPSADGYKGPWGPCITGAKGNEWSRQNCPK